MPVLCDPLQRMSLAQVQPHQARHTSRPSIGSSIVCGYNLTRWCVGWEQPPAPPGASQRANACAFSWSASKLLATAYSTSRAYGISTLICSYSVFLALESGCSQLIVSLLTAMKTSMLA